MIRRRLGGEATARDPWFGGERNRPRAVAMIAVAVAAAFLILSMYFVGLGISLVLFAAAWLGTMRTHRGSVLERVRRRLWWRELDRRGMRSFRPVEDRPADLDPALAPSRAEARAMEREWSAYRDMPDGVEGMYWLQAEPGRPGIAWHMPTGEAPYLSVAFAVSGAVRGLESDLFLDNCAHAFGRLVGSMAPRTSLAHTLQMITRVVPKDSARHERWVLNNYDKQAPHELLASYDELVARIGGGGLGQRHYAVVRWPIDATFQAEAARLGPAQEGWIALMQRQVPDMARALRRGGLGQVTPLTAAQVGAVIRHMQVPSWPLDEAGTIGQTGIYLPYDCHWSYAESIAPGPSGIEEHWLHRTAVLPAVDMEASERTALWLAPVLGQLAEPIIRTLSVTQEAIPAAQARAQASMDVTSDMADIDAARAKGQISDGEARRRLAAAQERMASLESGTGYQGLGWAIHLTISAHDRDALTEASVRIEEAANQAGVARLDWLDAYQGAAQSYTWPVARGMAPIPVAASQRIMSLVAGTGEKEAL